MSSEEKDLTIGEESVAALSLEQTGIDDDAVSTVESDSDRIDSIAAFCGMVWLVSIMDVCYSWFFPWEARYVIGSLFVFYATFILSNNDGLNNIQKNRPLFILLFLLIGFMIIRRFQILYIPFKFGPLLCILLWRKSALLKFYANFRKYIVFYAVLSIFVEFLVLSKLWVSLPYMTFPPQDNVQEALGYVNYFYGIFSIQATDFGLSFYRACGPVREGGHFAIFLGFIYFSEKAIFDKRNVWVFICGLLTLSPNFILAFFIAEVYAAIVKKQILKPILMFLGSIVFIIVGFLSSPKSIQNEIIGIILERTLEASIENMQTDGMMALIDGRAGVYGVSDYDAFLHKSLGTRLIGETLPEGNVMSDYRYLVLLFGYLGTTLIFIGIILFSLGRERNLFGLSLLSLGLIIFLHRAWMFVDLYHWTIMLLITNARIMYSELLPVTEEENAEESDTQNMDDVNLVPSFVDDKN